jgi:hypothetical protein
MSTTVYTSIDVANGIATEIFFWKDMDGTVPMNANIPARGKDAFIYWMQSKKAPTEGPGYSLQGICLKATTTASSCPEYSAKLNKIDGGLVRSAPGTASRPPSGTFDPNSQNQFIITWEKNANGVWRQAQTSPFSKQAGANGILMEDDNTVAEQAYEYFMFIGWNNNYYACDPKIYNDG